ncbi:MAG: MEDS domain-containing protein [Thermoproteota archaeon]|nr:MEDS domain-containing protein [Thermoproteota archaeon]
MASRKVIRGNHIHILRQLEKAKYGSHYIVVYPDLVTLREIYSTYAKAHIVESNDEIVIILPYYETTDTVRRVLSENGARIDVRKYEKENSLVIIDSYKAYLSSSVNIMTFFKSLVERAQQLGKNGVGVFGDIGSIAHLINYERSLPPKFDIKSKGFCCYNESDYNRLTEKQKQKSLDKHSKELMVTIN